MRYRKKLGPERVKRTVQKFKYYPIGSVTCSMCRWLREQKYALKYIRTKYVDDIINRL